MTNFPSAPPTNPGMLGATQPHRGGLMLGLGIGAIVLNFICGIGWILGIIVWIMANGDLKAMAAGYMDRTGEGQTKAGKICGIVSIVLTIVGIFLYIIFFVIVVGAGAAAGAAGAGSGGAPPMLHW
jgi:hypothetical protein